MIYRDRLEAEVQILRSRVGELEGVLDATTDVDAVARENRALKRRQRLGLMTRRAGLVFVVSFVMGLLLMAATSNAGFMLTAVGVGAVFGAGVIVGAIR